MKKLFYFAIYTVFFFSCSNKEISNKSHLVVINTEPIDSLISSYIIRNKIPGAVALISKSGIIQCNKAFGYNNKSAGIKQETDDIFRIASMTKPITSIAAMILYEEGKFELDDPLSMYIPEFLDPQILDKIDMSDSSFTSHSAGKEITIRHLFTQSSGIAYGFQDVKYMALLEKHGITEGFEEKDILLEDNIKKLATIPLKHTPGERYTYGLNTDVLGRLVEVWSGKSLDVFFKERIFDPLQMYNTYFYLPNNKHSKLTKVYMSTNIGIAETDFPDINYPIKGAQKYLSGGADLNSTAYDYYLFCQMLLNKGELNGVRILKEETVKLISSTHLETGDCDMGLGFEVLSAKTTDSRARSVGTISWGGFFTTTFWIDPKEEIVAILLLQMYPFNDWQIQQKFEDLIYSLI